MADSFQDFSIDLGVQSTFRHLRMKRRGEVTKMSAKPEMAEMPENQKWQGHL